MKKSEIYHLAQVTVVDSNLSARTKLEILRELMGKEDLAKFLEENKAEEAKKIGESV